MWMTELPPFVPFMIGALLAAFTQGKLRGAILISIPILSAIQLWGIPEGIHVQWMFLDYQLVLFRVDKLSLMFGYVFHIAALIAIIYSLHVKDTIQQVSAMVYAASGIGAVFVGDLLTLFVFWELMAFASVFLILARKSKRSYAVGMRYLVIQVLSGVILLAGTLFYAKEYGHIVFDYIGLDSVGGWLIFLAFGIKCAFPMLHNWLTEAYAEATVTGTVFLSAFTTKLAIYALARGYPGTDLLIYIGVTMACFPIFFAVIENDLRKVLAYSLINQLGFMVVGIGIGTALALNGTITHAFSHIIYKGLLFMSMGAVLHMTGRINGSDLGGLYKTMPKTTVLCIVGAASISAFPLFSGFISKSMIMSAALENGFEWIWLMLLFSAAGVFHHAGIKIPYFAFFAHDSGIRVSDPPKHMLLAMFIAAALCIGIGVYPAALYSLLPYETGYNPYDASHVLAQAQLLFFSALAFVWLNLKGLYPPELRSTNLDVDWIYRKALPKTMKMSFAFIWRVDHLARKFFMSRFDRLLSFLAQRHEGVSFLLSRAYPAGSMVMWVVLILAVYLILSFMNIH